MAAKTTKSNALSRPPSTPLAKRLHTVGVRLSDEQLAVIRGMANAEQRKVANMMSVLIGEAIAAREAKKT